MSTTDRQHPTMVCQAPFLGLLNSRYRCMRVAQGKVLDARYTSTGDLCLVFGNSRKGAKKNVANLIRLFEANNNIFWKKIFSFFDFVVFYSFFLLFLFHFGNLKDEEKAHDSVHSHKIHPRILFSCTCSNHLQRNLLSALAIL